MKSKRNILVLGGDLRQKRAAEGLSELGWSPTLWGVWQREGEGSDGALTLGDLLGEAEAVILPLPASADGQHLNCPFAGAEDRPTLSQIFSHLPSGAAVIGGRIPEEAARLAEGRGLRVFDYFESEAFQIHNAYTTAEAALSIAMNRLERNIRGSRVAITGFGRIAKHLVGLLLPMGARITVAARRSGDRAFAESMGCDSLALEEAGAIFSLAEGYDVIYNTVPHWLFRREFLERMDERTFLLDLASVPGGVDICAAKELGCNVLWATSLPGKYAPESAGELIATCLDEILRREVGLP